MIALTRRARRSNCSGRTLLRDALCGSRIWRDLLDGGFCQGLVSDRSSGESDGSSAFSDLSRTTSLSSYTTIPATSCATAPRSPESTLLVVDLSCLAASCFFRVLPPLLRCRRRECGRPIRLTRSLPLHAGKASTRSTDSGRQLLWRGLGPCGGRRRRAAILSASGRTCCVRWCGGTIGRAISAGLRQTARGP